MKDKLKLACIACVFLTNISSVVCSNQPMFEQLMLDQSIQQNIEKISEMILNPRTFAEEEIKKQMNQIIIYIQGEVKNQLQQIISLNNKEKIKKICDEKRYQTVLEVGQICIPIIQNLVQATNGMHDQEWQKFSQKIQRLIDTYKTRKKGNMIALNTLINKCEEEFQYAYNKHTDKTQHYNNIIIWSNLTRLKEIYTSHIDQYTGVKSSQKKRTNYLSKNK